MLFHRMAGAFGPRVYLRVFLRFDEPIIQRLAPHLILNDTLLHILQADALDPRRGAPR